MAQLTLPQNSRVGKGKHFPADGAPSKSRRFKIYRYDPDSGENPRTDTYDLDLDRCGPMVLDALIKIKNEVDATLTFRRSCREGICGSCAMNVDGTNTLACIKPIEEVKGEVRIYPLPHMPVVKDLVARHGGFLCPSTPPSSPGMKTDTAPPSSTERLQAPEDREKLDGIYECILCACCSTAARATGGTAIATWGPRPCCRPTAGSPTAATRRPANGSTSWRIPSGSTAATPS